MAVVPGKKKKKPSSSLESQGTARRKSPVFMKVLRHGTTTITWESPIWETNPPPPPTLGCCVIDLRDTDVFAQATMDSDKAAWLESLVEEAVGLFPDHDEPDLLRAQLLHATTLLDDGVQSREQAIRVMVAAVLKCCGHVLKLAVPAIRADRELVMEVVTVEWPAFAHAAEPLQDDRDVVMAALSLAAFPLEYASPRLQSDDIVVAKAVSMWGEALQWASADLQANREIVLLAVNSKGVALAHASSVLRGDREVVLAAVAQDADALQYASKATCPNPRIKGSGSHKL